MSKIFHASLRGLSCTKERELSTLNIRTTEWKDIDLESSSFYLFIPQNTDLLAEYDRGWKVTDIFPVNSMGITTARDELTIYWHRHEVLNSINDFASLSIDKARQKYNLIDDARDWKIHLAQEDLKQSGLSNNNVVPISYRPFDIRHTYYTGKSRGFHCMPRGEIMAHLVSGDNLALCCIRRSRENSISNFFLADKLIDKNILSSADNANVAPLYLYPTTQAEKDMGMTRTPNLSPEFFTQIERNLGCQPTPEAIFYYIYAIFHSPTYRSRYAEFLKIDFPRVPLTSDDKLFKQLATSGERLVNLHLMKSIQTGRGGDWESGLGGNSSAEVGAGYPKYESGKVTINKQGEGFINVPEAVWKFHVGGYQVCHKWLKDRKGRVLGAEDIAHYQGIVAALGETIEVMQAIDAAIPNWPLDAEYN